jgi:hypothetical protein
MGGDAKKIPSGVLRRRLGFDGYQAGSTDTAHRDLTQAGSRANLFATIRLAAVEH